MHFGFNLGWPYKYGEALKQSQSKTTNQPGTVSLQTNSLQTLTYLQVF